MAYKILVVDDDLAILRLIKRVLEYEKMCIRDRPFGANSSRYPA